MAPRWTWAVGTSCYVIAAAVIGGTSFAGGIGTIPGHPGRPRHGDAGLRAPATSACPRRTRTSRPGSSSSWRLASTVGTVGVATGARTEMTHDGAERVPLVEMRNIRVAFGGVHAVDDVTIDLLAGEVMGIVGGNGAGKSTLMRALSGAHRPTRARSSSTAEPSPSPTRGTRRLQDRDDLPDAGARRQRRCAGERLPRPRDDDAVGNPRRFRHGGRDAQGHGSAEPELHPLHSRR